MRSWLRLMVNALGRAGMSAMQANDAATALECFKKIVVAGKADLEVWLVIAVAYQRLGETDQLILAATKALEYDPQNIRALILKGDGFAAKGDMRSAFGFYDVVLKMVPDINAAPPEMARELRRIEKANNAHKENLFSHLVEHMKAAGYSGGSDRFDQSLELLAGKETAISATAACFLLSWAANAAILSS